MKCPRCGKPAYVGYTEVKCTNTACVHFDQREADDFAARKTLPPKTGPKIYPPGSVKITIGGKTLTSAGTPAPWGTPQGGRAGLGYFSTGLAECPKCKCSPSEYYVAAPRGETLCPKCGFQHTHPHSVSALALAVAKSSVLDTWGTILSAPRRPGETDDQYRARLASLLP